MVEISWVSSARGHYQYPWSMSSFQRYFAPRNFAMIASWFGMVTGTSPTCLLTAR